MQLGAEGFAVRFLNTLVGLMTVAVTDLLVKVESLQTQRFALMVVIAIGWWAVRKVIYLDMLVRSQSETVQDRVRDAPFSHTLIGGDPSPLGSGPPPPHAYKRHASQG
jgi:hypothetical protein